MKKIVTYVLMALVVLGMASCVKDKISADKYYYGNVNIKLVNFPGTDPMDVYFNNEKLGTVQTYGSATFQIIEGKPGHIRLFRSGTDSLRLDTLISVARNQTISLSAAYSKLSGVAGFLNVGQPIAADSIGIQLLNGFSTKLPDKVDVKFSYYDDLYNVVPAGLTIKGLPRNQLSSQVIKLKALDANGYAIIYLIEINDSATGQPIIDPYGSNYYFIDVLPGETYILKLFDDPSDLIYAQKLNI